MKQARLEEERALSSLLCPPFLFRRISSSPPSRISADPLTERQQGGRGRWVSLSLTTRCSSSGCRWCWASPPATSSAAPASPTPSPFSSSASRSAPLVRDGTSSPRLHVQQWMEGIPPFSFPTCKISYYSIQPLIAPQFSLFTCSTV
jgi:hypothetical protein